MLRAESVTICMVLREQLQTFLENPLGSSRPPRWVIWVNISDGLLACPVPCLAVLRLGSKLLISIDDIAVCVISGACFLFHSCNDDLEERTVLVLWTQDEWKNVSFCVVMQATKCDDLYRDIRQCSHQESVVELMSTHFPCSNSILFSGIDVWLSVSCTFSKCFAMGCLQFGGVNWWYKMVSDFGYARVVLCLTSVLWIEWISFDSTLRLSWFAHTGLLPKFVRFLFFTKRCVGDLRFCIVFVPLVPGHN